MRRQTRQFSLRVKTESTEMPSVEDKKEYTAIEAREEYIRCEKLIWDLKDQNRDINRRSHNDIRTRKNTEEIRRLRSFQDELYIILTQHRMATKLSTELFGREYELRTRHHKRKHDIDHTGRKRKR